MTDLAVLVLPVSDLVRSVGFYRDRLGFAYEWTDSDGKVARLLAPGGEILLLTAPGSAEVGHLLVSNAFRPKPGGRVYLRGATPELRDVLEHRHGPEGLTWIDQPWGIRELLLHDPDRYEVCFFEVPTRSDSEILHWYQVGPDRLEEAQRGLTEADLDLARAPGKWSIRQIVHHVVDAEASMLPWVKHALAEPGRSYHPQIYDQDVWAAALDYAGRPVGPEVTLFRALRTHVQGLLEHFPDALDRSVLVRNERSQTVRELLKLMGGHALDHIEQVFETRRLHGR